MENLTLEEGDLVLCVVEKIIGTTVFVKINDQNEGTLTTSEIAPGRIRNLRDYVVPGKHIVCKILSIKGNSSQLSLRRVGINEKKDFLQKSEKERANHAILKTVLGIEELEKFIKNYPGNSLTELFNESKENPKILESYTSKENAEKIIKILESKKEKPKEIRQIFKLSTKSENGITTIKNIIQKSCVGSKCSVNYLAAGKYSMSITGKDFKEIKTELTKTIDSIDKLAKKEHCEFDYEKN